MFILTSENLLNIKFIRRGFCPPEVTYLWPETHREKCFEGMLKFSLKIQFSEISRKTKKTAILVYVDGSFSGENRPLTHLQMLQKIFNYFSSCFFCGEKLRKLIL